MPKKSLSIKITNKFKTTDDTARKAAFTAKMAGWINSVEKAKSALKL